MIHLHAWVFLVVLELMLVGVALWLVWLFKARRLGRALALAKSQSLAPPAEPDRTGYIAAELQATRDWLEAHPDVDAQITAPLGLRAACLEVERDLAQERSRDEAFWEQAQERLGVVFAQLAPPAPAPLPEPQAENLEQATEGSVEEGGQRVKQLIDDQVSTLNELKEVLDALGGDHEHAPKILERIGKLGRTNRELASCVSILEDDNNFLRSKLREAGISTD